MATTILYPTDKGVPVGVVCTVDDLDRMLGLMSSGIASFDKDKEMVLKCACQNYVFSCEQASKLLGSMSWDSAQADGVALFKDRLTDPADGAETLLAVVDDESDREAAAAMVATFTPAEPREVAVFQVEDDGARSDDDVDALVTAMKSASFSSDRVKAAEGEVERLPSPPLSGEQLSRVLSEITFSSDACNVVEILVGPKLVYPMQCEEILALLSKYAMSSGKLKMLATLKPLIKDAQNKASLVSSFEFSSDKEAAEEILRDVLVDVVPPVPPVAKIQEALQKIGTCRAGYAWRQVSGGWRCAAGGHYCSDAQVAAAI